MQDTTASWGLRTTSSPPATPERREFDLLKTQYVGAREILRILRRRRWFIAGFVAVIGLLTLAFLAWTAPTYTATTSVLVLPTGQTMPTTGDSTLTAAPTPIQDADIQSKVELFKSPSLAKRTANSLLLQNDKEFAPGPSSTGIIDTMLKWLTPRAPADFSPSDQAAAAANAREEAIATNLINHLDVERVARSNVIEINASSTDPVKAARIANRLVDIYVRNQFDDANGDRQAQLASLTARAVKARQELERLDAAAAAYRKAHGLLTSDPTTRGAGVTDQLSGLYAQARSESAERGRLAAPAHTASGDISATSPLLTDLQQQEATLQRKMSELTSFYGPNYPDVVQTAAQLQALQGRIAQERTRVGADLKVAAQASKAKSSVIGAAMSGASTRSLADGTAAVQLKAMEREGDAASAQYTALLGQINTIMGSIGHQADISRISRASIPDVPSYPLPKRVIAIAVVAGFILGSLLALVLELADSKLRTAEQVGFVLGIPTLAMIPEVRGHGGAIHEEVANRPRSRFAEAMRNLLIEIEARLPGKPSRVIVLTSPLQNEGKSTVAKSLAAAAASVQRHVAIIDFDLRRPEGSDVALASGTPSAGIVAYLTDRAPIEDLVTPQHRDAQLAVIEAGEVAADPAALIASPRLATMMEHLRHQFDLVIVNAPPILLVRDAKTLAAYADATLLVLRWGTSEPEAAAAATEIFGRPFEGAIMNRVDYPVHASRRYGDALQHVAASNSYYELEESERRWLGMRWPVRLMRWSGLRARTAH